MAQETGENLTDPEISDRQERFLEALMTSATVTAAAAKAKVGERTAFRWLAQDPRFRTAYRQARRASVEQSMVLIGSGVAIATSTLLKICSDTAAPASARVAAAGKVLDMALRSLEMDDLSARLEALEAALLPPEVATNGKAPQTAR